MRRMMGCADSWTEFRRHRTIQEKIQFVRRIFKWFRKMNLFLIYTEYWELLCWRMLKCFDSSAVCLEYTNTNHQAFTCMHTRTFTWCMSRVIIFTTHAACMCSSVDCSRMSRSAAVEGDLYFFFVSSGNDFYLQMKCTRFFCCIVIHQFKHLQEVSFCHAINKAIILWKILTMKDLPILVNIR